MPMRILSALSDRVTNALRPPERFNFPTAGLELLADWAITNFDFKPATSREKGKEWRRFDDMDAGLIHLQSDMTFWDRTDAWPHHGLFSITFDKYGFPTEAMAVSNLVDPRGIIHWGVAPDFAVLKGLNNFCDLEKIVAPRAELQQSMLEGAKLAWETIEVPDHLKMLPLVDWTHRKLPSGVILERLVRLQTRDQGTVDYHSTATLTVEFDAEGNPLGAWLNTERRKPVAMLDAETLSPSNNGPKM